MSGARPLRNVQAAARGVLAAASPAQKQRLAWAAAAAFSRGELAIARDGVEAPPERPARPDKPVLLPPGQMARRRLGSVEGRIALLHAIAHIELNAIDLAFDLIARFAADADIVEEARGEFVSEWLGVGVDEARHFGLLQDRLAELGAAYGDLPAHDGLWRAAQATSDDLAARLAVAPMVLEARGLDVTPGMIERLSGVGDHRSAEILNVIYEEEIPHVAAGARWFKHVCARRGESAVEVFRRLVAARFAGEIRGPFNEDARAAAGLHADFYRPLQRELS